MADPASGSGDKSVQVKLVLLGEALHPDSQHGALCSDPLHAQSIWHTPGNNMLDTRTRC